MPQWRLSIAGGHVLPISTLLFWLRFRQSGRYSTSATYHRGTATEAARRKSTSTQASGKPSALCCHAHSRPPDERPRRSVLFNALGMYLNALGSGAGRMVDYSHCIILRCVERSPWTEFTQGKCLYIEHTMSFSDVSNHLHVHDVLDFLSSVRKPALGSSVWGISVASDARIP